MFEILLVRVSVWLASIAWFIGAVCRQRASKSSTTKSDSSHPRETLEKIYRWSWLVGSLFMFVHIISSYGFVHHWSHQAAVLHTADVSFETTGIRAGWGVYVNFLFALLWLIYSSTMIFAARRIPIIDLVVFVFLAVIIACATIVFETGVIRLVALAAALFLVIDNDKLKYRPPLQHINKS